MLKKDYLKLFPTDWVFWTMLGISSLHLSDVQAAKDSFQHALQTTNQIEPFHYLSQCHIMEGDIKSAIFVLRRATESVLNSSFPICWNTVCSTERFRFVRLFSYPLSRASPASTIVRKPKID